MPSINIQAPVDQVFKAMCDLSRHANWATHDITIEAGREGPPAVGNTYTSSHQGKTPDRLTVTEMRPNERFVFHSVMKPDKFELDYKNTGRDVTHEADVWPSHVRTREKVSEQHEGRTGESSFIAPRHGPRVILIYSEAATRK